MIINIGDVQIEYTHIINPKLKRSYISIDADNKVTVKTPIVPESKVAELVSRKAGWIIKKQAVMRESLNDHKFHNGALFPYLGEMYPVKLVEDATAGIGKAQIRLTDAHFLVTYNPYLMKEAYMQKALNAFYAEMAEQRITQITNKWVGIMSLTFGRISFKKLKSRWGSCTAKGDLMFNIELIKLPMECIEYVVIHELAHMVSLRHDKLFWSVVAQYAPNYKEIRNTMKRYKL